MQYQFIQNHQSEFRTEEMCECFDLGRSSYYSWSRRKPCARALEDKSYKERIRMIPIACHLIYLIYSATKRHQQSHKPRANSLFQSFPF